VLFQGYRFIRTLKLKLKKIVSFKKEKTYIFETKKYIKKTYLTTTFLEKVLGEINFFGQIIHCINLSDTNENNPLLLLFLDQNNTNPYIYNISMIIGNISITSSA